VRQLWLQIVVSIAYWMRSNLRAIGFLEIALWSVVSKNLKVMMLKGILFFKN
jgi:hypothetical protein